MKDTIFLFSLRNRKR